MFNRNYRYLIVLLFCLLPSLSFGGGYVINSFGTFGGSGGGGALKDDANAMGVWYFENDGTDETTNANDLTNVNSATFETTAPTPKQGTYSTLLASASDQEWSSASTSFDVTGSFSMGGWFNPSSGALQLEMMSKHGASGQYGFILKQKTTGKVEFGISSTGSNFDSAETFASAVATDTWTHIVAVHEDGVDLKMYIDGTALADTVYPYIYTAGVNDTTADFIIGSSVLGGTGSDYNGNMDELFFFNRVLSASEISSIYSSGLE